ncbi:SPFH domain-containing protein [Pseudoteredinibacter isoporae]|uniref:Protein QmcA n=1 Tax=Pseudoteredinibacter isoporae TaxID=570281 RepID=A0A7X0MYI2_9GAMM|nr:SPFH domain-containing protein [Pseudoteredinibacter isoporae]MBB6523114.1 regulator of protease activity HflC (stomatin/prohibitin superfamily) [Pseudoteredinibacter isoporae]NHO88634.1 SPFH/Band 7/PHB domain protein [Pseudoteredinibacter isoporae]NIB22675.1 SPFH/Band 7/PHB domain protein [Pseudoteredinibacter isoporae]
MVDVNITVVVVAVLAIIVILKAVKSVPQGEEWTVERFGKYTRLLRPGLQMIVPFIDSIGHRQIVMEQVLDIQPQEVISADNAMVTTDAVCFYQVVDSVKASYEVNNLERAMQNLVMTNIRAVLGSMELDAMLSNRDQINNALLTKVDEATNPWGIKVTRIEIKDITPPRDLVDAMANQMKAEREKRAQILLAEGERESAIKVAEGEKRSQILRAEGERESAFLEAEAREREAQAEAKATFMVSEAIAKGNSQAINYFVAQKYVDALGQIASADNSKVVLMPLEASSVIGSIEGIHELVKSAKQS